MRHERLSLEDLELVRSIGTCGSLAGAVKALGVDHSSAFRRLAAIESRTGVALFRRSRRGYTPTDAGELVIVAAQRILADAEGLQRQLAGGDARAEGRIRITVPDTLMRVTASMCAAFVAAHPALRCDLVVANAFSSLQQRDVDVALRASTSPPDGLSAKRLGPIATAAYAPVGEKRGAALPGGRWIGFDETLSHLSSARWLREHVPDAAIAMRVNALPAALAACQAGIGRALLPAYFGDAADGVKRLSTALPDIPHRPVVRDAPGPAALGAGAIAAGVCRGLVACACRGDLRAATVSLAGPAADPANEPAGPPAGSPNTHRFGPAFRT